MVFLYTITKTIFLKSIIYNEFTNKKALYLKIPIRLIPPEKLFKKYLNEHPLGF